MTKSTFVSLLASTVLVGVAALAVAPAAHAQGADAATALTLHPPRIATSWVLGLGFWATCSQTRGRPGTFGKSRRSNPV